MYIDQHIFLRKKINTKDIIPPKDLKKLSPSPPAKIQVI